MSTANNRENILVWDNNHNGHLNDLGLSFYIRHKYFLQRPILLLTPSLISSNTLPLSLSVSPLSCSLPRTSIWVFNPVMSNKKYHWINAFCKELFSFLKVAPTQKSAIRAMNVFLSVGTLLSVGTFLSLELSCQFEHFWPRTYFC